jgi:hypothetical protein
VTRMARPKPVQRQQARFMLAHTMDAWAWVLDRAVDI